MPILTPEQKSEVCLIISIGCPLETAARYVGCLVEDVRRAVLADDQFAREFAKAEASIELTHMRAVQQAVKDDRHWRASVWWLERHAPEYYALRQADSITAAEWRRMIEDLKKAIREEVKCEEGQQRLSRLINDLANQQEVI